METNDKSHISNVSNTLLNDDILNVLLDYNEYLFTFIDRDSVGIGTEKKHVIMWYKWYCEHNTVND